MDETRGGGVTHPVIAFVRREAGEVARVDDYDRGPIEDLRDALIQECGMGGVTAYELATVATDAADLWDQLTALEPLTIGGEERSVRSALGKARDLTDHPALDVDDHPLALGSCIALQGRSAKNHSCPNSSYGRSLLCGMHQDADLRGTVLADES